MNTLPKFYRLISNLSIDVALGAVCCAAWFAKVLQVQLRPYALLALGFTVWIIYTADHLMDARKIKHIASTGRHRFHQRYFTTLMVCLLIALLIDITFLFFIRTKIINAGFILAFVVVLYLLLNRWLGFAKELMVGIVYCCGVLLPAISLRDFLLTSSEYVLIASFFLTAFINLILFSWYDADADQTDGYRSLALVLGIRQTKRILVVFFVLQLVLLSCLLVKTDISNTTLLLAMNAGLLLLFIRPSSFYAHDAFRYLGDAIFLFPGVLLVIG